MDRHPVVDGWAAAVLAAAVQVVAASGDAADLLGAYSLLMGVLPPEASPGVAVDRAAASVDAAAGAAA